METRSFVGSFGAISGPSSSRAKPKRSQISTAGRRLDGILRGLEARHRLPLTSRAGPGPLSMKERSARGMSGSTSALVGPGAIVAGRYRLDALIGGGVVGAGWSPTHPVLGPAIALQLVYTQCVS